MIHLHVIPIKAILLKLSHPWKWNPHKFRDLGHKASVKLKIEYKNKLLILLMMKSKWRIPHLLLEKQIKKNRWLLQRQKDNINLKKGYHQNLLLTVTKLTKLSSTAWGKVIMMSKSSRLRQKIKVLWPSRKNTLIFSTKFYQTMS